METKTLLNELMNQCFGNMDVVKRIEILQYPNRFLHTEYEIEMPSITINNLIDYKLYSLQDNVGWVFILMSCKGICIRHKAEASPKEYRYTNGQKRCQTCDIFLVWSGLWCPCCGLRLRTRPRNAKHKNPLMTGKIYIE